MHLSAGDLLREERKKPGSEVRLFIFNTIDTVDTLPNLMTSVPFVKAFAPRSDMIINFVVFIFIYSYSHSSSGS